MYHVRRSSDNVSRKLSVCIGHSPLVNAQIFGIVRFRMGQNCTLTNKDRVSSVWIRTGVEREWGGESGRMDLGTTQVCNKHILGKPSRELWSFMSCAVVNTGRDSNVSLTHEAVKTV